MPTQITSAGITFTDTTTLTSADGVPSALKLTTARTINGVAFDGTANITVPATASGANVAKAWVNFNGTGSIGVNQTIRSSYNVSSVTKSATGTYTINFVSGALTGADYLVVCGSMNRQSSGNASPDQTGILLGSTNTASLKTASQLSIGYMGGGNAYDGSEIHVAIFEN
jgi:hypothetical protein